MNKAFTIILILVTIFSCKKKESKENIKDKDAVFQYTYNDGITKFNVPVNKKPLRAVTTAPFLTEMLLSLGLENRMVFGLAEGKIYKDFQKAFQKVPNKDTSGIHYSFTKEAFLLLEPDFVAGWDGSIKATTTGLPESLIKSGIYPYASLTTKNGATLDTLYKEYRILGKIFGVEKRADSLINNFKNRLKVAVKNFDDSKKKKTVVMMELEEGGNILVASSLATDLIERANGINAFGDLPKDFERVSVEALLERNPDVIFFYRTGSSPHLTIEEDLKYIKTHPAIKKLDAIKNNRIHLIDLTDLAPGIRNIDLIIKINQVLYQ